MPKCIMVIDDTQEILELFEIILSDAGYDVSLHSYSTRDIDDVLRIKPDLIVSDHVPTEEKQGWQFLQKLKMTRATEDIPLIICTTSSTMVRDNEGWLRSKGVTVVPKPFSIDELLAAVRQRMGDAAGPGQAPAAP